MTESCKTCAAWRNPMVVVGASRETGECRRRAPHPQPSNRWPRTFPDEWCAEHLPKVPRPRRLSKASPDDSSFPASPKRV